MAILNYKNIDFKKSIDNETIKLNFNNNEIEIVKYLSIHEKYDLIMITLQKSFEEGIYNKIKLDMYFKLHIIYLYTNIIFDIEDRADEEGLYDLLVKSGLVTSVLNNMDQEELKYISNLLINVEEQLTKYHTSFRGSLEDFIKDIFQFLEKLKTMTPEDWEIMKESPVFQGLLDKIKLPFKNEK